MYFLTTVCWVLFVQVLCCASASIEEPETLEDQERPLPDSGNIIENLRKIQKNVLTERQKKRCENCKESIRCKTQGKCELCTRICKELDVLPISEQSQADTQATARDQNDPELLQRPGRFYTLGIFGPGPRQDLLARLFNIRRRDNLDQLLLLAKAKPTTTDKEKFINKPLIIDTANIFGKKEVEPTILQLESPSNEKMGIDLAFEIERKLNSELEKYEHNLLTDAQIDILIIRALSNKNEEEKANFEKPSALEPTHITTKRSIYDIETKPNAYDSENPIDDTILETKRNADLREYENSQMLQQGKDESFKNLESVTQSENVVQFKGAQTVTTFAPSNNNYQMFPEQVGAINQELLQKTISKSQNHNIAADMFDKGFQEVKQIINGAIKDNGNNVSELSTSKISSILKSLEKQVENVANLVKETCGKQNWHRNNIDGNNLSPARITNAIEELKNNTEVAIDSAKKVNNDLLQYVYSTVNEQETTTSSVIDRVDNPLKNPIINSRASFESKDRTPLGNLHTESIEESSTSTQNAEETLIYKTENPNVKSTTIHFKPQSDFTENSNDLPRSEEINRLKNLESIHVDKETTPNQETDITLSPDINDDNAGPHPFIVGLQNNVTSESIEVTEAVTSRSNDDQSLVTRSENVEGSSEEDLKIINLPEHAQTNNNPQVSNNGAVPTDIKTKNPGINRKAEQDVKSEKPYNTTGTQTHDHYISQTHPDEMNIYNENPLHTMSPNKISEERNVEDEVAQGRESFSDKDLTNSSKQIITDVTPDDNIADSTITDLQNVLGQNQILDTVTHSILNFPKTPNFFKKSVIPKLQPTPIQSNNEKKSAAANREAPQEFQISYDEIEDSSESTFSKANIKTDLSSTVAPFQKDTTNLQLTNLPLLQRFGETPQEEELDSNKLNHAFSAEFPLSETNDIPSQETNPMSIFGKLVSQINDTDSVHNKIYFMGNGMQLPLKLKKEQDGSIQLSVDVDSLCTCKSKSCQHEINAVPNRQDLQQKYQNIPEIKDIEGRSRKSGLSKRSPDLPIPLPILNLQTLRSQQNNDSTKKRGLFAKSFKKINNIKHNAEKRIKSNKGYIRHNKNVSENLGEKTNVSEQRPLLLDNVLKWIKQLTTRNMQNQNIK